MTESGALARIMRTEEQPDEYGNRPFGGVYARWFFPNGYGASVVQGGGTYGVELAVLKGTRGAWDLTYETPVTSDVIGWIETPEDLGTILNQIRSLPSAAEAIEGASA